MPILDRSRKERSIQGRFVTEVYDKTRREMCKGSCLGDDSPTSGVEFKRAELRTKSGTRELSLRELEVLNGLMHNKDDLYLSVKFYQQLADDTSGGIDRRVIEAGLIPKGLVSIRQCKGVEKYLLTPIALDGEYTVILFPCIHLNNH